MEEQIDTKKIIEDDNNDMDEMDYGDECEEEIFDIHELDNLKKTIENMSKFNQIEVLRILYGNKDVVLNENKYGTHINLSELDNKIVRELKKFVEYVNDQETTLNNVEKQKEEYKKLFVKDIKDNSIKNNKTTNVKSKKLQF